MTPFFSIVIPLYNKEPHVARCLRSVEQQTWTDYEVIVVDDASTDEGVERVREFGLPNLRLLKRDHPGRGGNAARNFAIEEANAEWICFLDADDEWLPGHLAELARTISDCPRADVVANRFLQAWGDSSITVGAERAGDRREFDLTAYLRVHSRGDDLLHVSSVAVKCSSLRAIGGFPETKATCQRAGDGQTWLRLMHNDGLLAMSSSPGGIYHQDAVNMATRKRYYEWWENCLITCLDELVESGKGGRHTPLLKKYRNHRIISTIFQKLGTGTLAWQDLVTVWRYRQNNARVPLIVVGVVWPSLGRLLFRVKRLRRRPSGSGR